jgi:hypothetical protein
MTIFASARSRLLAAVTLSLAALPLVASASVFGTNLIVNGDAEGSVGSSNGENNGSTPGFATTGTFAVVQYNLGGGFPSAGDPGVAAGGANFFAGGTPGPSTASQMIDVSSGSTIIDLGTTSFSLSALLGGFATQADNAMLTITFLNSVNASVGSASLGPVSEIDRGGLTGLLPISDSGFVPTGTRSIDVLLTLTRFQGSYDDGYADNLALSLTAGAVPTGGVPEPATWALMMMGLGGLGAALRSSRKGTFAET